MRRSMNLSLIAASLMISGALSPIADDVEEVVVTPRPKRADPAPEQPEQTVLPASRQHRRALERAARKRRPQGDRP